MLTSLRGTRTDPDQARDHERLLVVVRAVHHRVFDQDSPLLLPCSGHQLFYRCILLFLTQLAALMAQAIRVTPFHLHKI